MAAPYKRVRLRGGTSFLDATERREHARSHRMHLRLVGSASVCQVEQRERFVEITSELQQRVREHEGSLRAAFRERHDGQERLHRLLDAAELDAS